MERRERGGYWRGGRGVGIGEEGEGWVLERRERVGIGEEGEGGYWGGRGVGIGEEGEEWVLERRERGGYWRGGREVGIGKDGSLTHRKIGT